MRRVSLVFILAMTLRCVGNASNPSLDAGSEPVDAGSEPHDAGFEHDAGSQPDAGRPYIDPDAGWGAGSNLGTIVGDVWTPGRDENGFVNLDSWKLVPVDRWVTVADTKLSDLEPQIKAAMPGWNDYGSGDWTAVTDAWNAPAVDFEGSRAWWLASGGHADSSNNGIYRFDAFKMAYAIEHMPSDTTKWSERYRGLVASGTFTYNPESDQTYKDGLDAGVAYNGWFYDELPYDRAPTARHTYSGTIYLPKTKELVMAVRRLWRYSLVTGTWSATKRLPGDNASNNLGEENIVALDPTKDELLISACGSGGPWGDTFALGSETWSGGGPPWNSWDWSGAADTTYGTKISMLRNPEDPASGNYASPGRYLRYDVVTRQVEVSGNVQFADGLTQVDFSGGEDGAGMVYVPSANRYWAAMKLKARGLTWFELDPTTTPWTLRLLTQLGAVPALTNNSTLIRRRMFYLPHLDAILFLGSGTKNISLYRL